MSSPRMNRWAAAAVAAALGPATVAAQATPGNEELLLRIDELNQKLLVLERKLELQDEASQTAVKSTTVVKASPKGFSLESPDKNNVVKLRGTLHFDGRHYQDDVTPETADTWLLRRVRPTAAVTAAAARGRRSAGPRRSAWRNRRRVRSGDASGAARTSG